MAKDEIAALRRELKTAETLGLEFGTVSRW